MSDMPDHARGGASCAGGEGLGGLGAVEAPRSSSGCKRTDGWRLRLERLGGGVSESSTAHPAKGRVEMVRLQGALPSTAASGCDLGGGPCRDQATLNDTLVFALEPILGTGCRVNPFGLGCRWFRGVLHRGCAGT